MIKSNTYFSISNFIDLLHTLQDGLFIFLSLHLKQKWHILIFTY